MKIYLFNQYGDGESFTHGVYDNLEDVAQVVEKMVAHSRKVWGHTREESLKYFGIEVYDLNTYYEYGKSETYYQSDIDKLLYPQNN